MLIEVFYIQSLFSCMLQCVVTVNDNGYPNNNLATANVVIFVTRDVSLPVFTNNARYAVTINENQPIGDGIITVSASRQGLLVSIYILFCLGKFLIS